MASIPNKLLSTPHPIVQAAKQQLANVKQLNGKLNALIAQHSHQSIMAAVQESAARHEAGR